MYLGKKGMNFGKKEEMESAFMAFVGQKTAENGIVIKIDRSFIPLPQTEFEKRLCG